VSSSLNVVSNASIVVNSCVPLAVACMLSRHQRHSSRITTALLLAAAAAAAAAALVTHRSSNLLLACWLL